MRLQQGRSKGIALTISAILESLFFIGVVGLGFWFFLTKLLDIHVAVLSADNERHAMNLANVLLSYRGIAYESEEKIHRGVLDIRKLDSFGIKWYSRGMDPANNETFDQASFEKIFKYYRRIEFAYPNTINFVSIVDLENCEEERGCVVWSTIILGPTNLEENAISSFMDCMYNEFMSEIGKPRTWVGSISGCVAGGMVGAAVGSVVPALGNALGAAIGCGVGLLIYWWQDISNCGINAMPETVKYFFTSGSFVAAQGLPTLIRYADGTTHAGRIMVGVIEWYT